MSKLEKKKISYKSTLLLICSLLFTLTMLAQQDAQYTQYMYNTVSVNPGYAGSRGHMSIGLLHRSQWVGIEGAPKTQTFNIHTPIGYRGLGLGVSLVNDEIGPTSESNFDLDLSYTIQTSREAKLSFGVKASANLLDVRFSELDEYATDGALFGQDIQNRLSPNVGAGVYYHTNDFYAGLSVPRFLQTSHFDESSLSTAKENINFYFITGYVYDINPFLKFKPAMLAKVTSGAPLQLDLSASFLINKEFMLGVAYRWDAAVSALAGLQVSEQFLVGIAYDREITEFGQAIFNDGSFEIVLRFDFISSRGNLRSPRFF